MEHWRAQFRRAIQVTGFRSMNLLNGSIIFSLRKPLIDDPVLLVVEGYYSNTKHFDVVDKPREQGVALVSLPPHSTHVIHPLDVAIMKPLKTYYAQETERCLGSNPGRVVNAFRSVQVVRACL